MIKSGERDILVKGVEFRGLASKLRDHVDSSDHSEYGRYFFRWQRSVAKGLEVRGRGREWIEAEKRRTCNGKDSSCSAKSTA